MTAKRDVPEWALEFKAHCVRKGLGTKEVSTVIGVSYGMVINYFNGSKRPRFEICKRIQNNLGFDILKALYLHDRKVIEGGEDGTNESEI